MSLILPSRRSLLTGAAALAAMAVLPTDEASANLLLTGAGAPAAGSAPTTPITIFGSDLLLWYDLQDTATMNGGSIANTDPISSITSKGTITEALTAAGADRPVWSTSGSPNGFASADWSNKFMITANNITMNPGNSLFVGLVFKATGFGGYGGIWGVNESAGGISGYGMQRAGGAALGWQSEDMIAFGGGGYVSTPPRVIMDDTPSSLWNGSYHIFSMQIGTANSVAVDASSQTLRTGLGESSTGACISVTDKFTLGCQDTTGSERIPTGAFVCAVFAKNPSAGQITSFNSYAATL